MHILLFTLQLYDGGAERVIANLGNELQSLGHHISIVTCLNKGKSLEYAVKPSIKHYYLDEADEKKQNKLFRFINRTQKFEQCVKEIRPEIILVMLPEPCFIALYLRRRLKIPVICSVRSNPKVEFRFLPYYCLMRLLYPRADGFVFQTKGAQEFFPKVIQKKSVIIPNPLNKEACQKRYEGKRNKEIVAVGRLEKIKNYPLLLRVFSKLGSEFKDYTLCIYGMGPEEDNIKQLSRMLNIENRVILKGQVGNVFKLINRSALYILTSVSEGMPNALMEAMALGLPVIATDCPSGGPKFLIQSGYNGELIPSNDEEALYKAIVRILTDVKYADYLGANAAKIQEELDPSKIFHHWENYIVLTNELSKKE